MDQQTAILFWSEKPAKQTQWKFDMVDLSFDK